MRPGRAVVALYGAHPVIIGNRGLQSRKYGLGSSHHPLFIHINRVVLAVSNRNIIDGQVPFLLMVGKAECLHLVGLGKLIRERMFRRIFVGNRSQDTPLLVTHLFHDQIRARSLRRKAVHKRHARHIRIILRRFYILTVVLQAHRRRRCARAGIRCIVARCRSRPTFRQRFARRAYLVKPFRNGYRAVAFEGEAIHFIAFGTLYRLPAGHETLAGNIVWLAQRGSLQFGRGKEPFA